MTLKTAGYILICISSIYVPFPCLLIYINVLCHTSRLTVAVCCIIHMCLHYRTRKSTLKLKYNLLSSLIVLFWFLRHRGERKLNINGITVRSANRDSPRTTVRKRNNNTLFFLVLFAQRFKLIPSCLSASFPHHAVFKVIRNDLRH